MPELLNIRELSKKLKISMTTIYRMVESGEIPYISIGVGKKKPRIGFSPTSIDGWLLFIEKQAVINPTKKYNSISKGGL